MVEDGSLRVLAILSRASAVIAEGEVLQLMTANDTATTEQRLSRGHQRQDRGAVRRRLPKSAPSSPTGRAPKRRRWRASASTSASPSSWSTTCWTIRPTQASPRQDRRRRFPRGQDHAAGHPRLPARRRDGARLLAPHAGGARNSSDGDLAHAHAADAPRTARSSDTVERARHYGAIARDALGIFPDERRQARADRGGRFLHRPGVLAGARRPASPGEGHYEPELTRLASAGRRLYIPRAQKFPTGAVWPRSVCRSVAQPGRALRSGRRGRRFESSHSDHSFRRLKSDQIGNRARLCAPAAVRGIVRSVQ